MSKLCRSERWFHILLFFSFLVLFTQTTSSTTSKLQVFSHEHFSSHHSESPSYSITTSDSSDIQSLDPILDTLSSVHTSSEVSVTNSVRYYYDRVIPTVIPFSNHFRWCGNYSEHMVPKSRIFYDSLTMQSIPNQFSCQNIYLANSFSIMVGAASKLMYGSHKKELIFSRLQPNRAVSDLCSRVQEWEEKLTLSCEKLFCDTNSTNLNRYITLQTQSATNILDWINYCRYCSTNWSGPRFELNSGKCKNQTFDFGIRKVLEQFPTHLKYCGYSEFGIPLITPNIGRYYSDYSGSLDYIYVCYCPEGDYFGFYCSFGNQDFILSNSMVYIAFTAHIITFIGVLLVVCLPKTVVSCKQRKFKKSFTISCVTTSELTSVIAYQEFNYFASGLGLVAVPLFIAIAIWMYIVISRMSDINVLQTSNVRFIIFASILSTFISLTFTVSALLDSPVSDPTNGVFIFVTHLLLVALMQGLALMEFDKSEFGDFYKCFKKIKLPKLKRKNALSVDESLSVEQQHHAMLLSTTLVEEQQNEKMTSTLDDSTILSITDHSNPSTHYVSFSRDHDD
ncbi:hypothetical protein C9374_005498 [Naegleria lovaniensis]|uniref:Uncharacterized protein n=1 Tax=Naegleria lovaniensis TaxID=51637 RepID=A0AA88KN85_NAELO|nr:uncharacterized protein C9374_005498 [Naegleria lovaniensis]KAG2382296.1 hypothetical protein C9374_005498 [Naegleria lovaniensis]